MGQKAESFVKKVDPFVRMVQKEKDKSKAEPNPVTPESEKPKSVAETGQVVEQSMVSRKRQQRGRMSTLMSTAGQGGRDTSGTPKSSVPGGVYSTASSSGQKLGG